MSDAYFEKKKNLLAMANRAGGKTLDVAILNVLNAGFKGAGVADVAGSKQQAKKCYDYSKTFWFMDDALSKKLQGEPLMSETRLKNGAKYEILAASPTSVRSPHCPKLCMDEIEEMKEEVYVGALPIATTQNGIEAQIVMTSTRHKPYGRMQNALDEADEKGFAVYKWCVWETMQPCTHDCKTCPMVEYCKGRAKNADGYATYEDVLQQFNVNDKMTWESEHCCMKPSTEKLVYAQFDPDIHLIDESLVPVGLRLWGCVDWGYDNPFVFIPFGVAGNDVKYALGESYRRHKTDSALAEEMHDIYPYIRDVCCDPSNPSGIEEFEKVGFRMHRRASEVLDGIAEVRKDLSPNVGPPRLYLVKGKTKNLTREFQTYEVREGSDEPKKENDHGPDAIRYYYAVNVLGGPGEIEIMEDLCQR